MTMRTTTQSKPLGMLGAFFFLLVKLSSPASAAEDPSVTVEKTSVPTWVYEQTVPDFPQHRLSAVRDGIAELLNSNQFRRVKGGYQYFHHLAYKVTDRAGLERAARISRSFDPSLATLSFNFVRVHRGSTIEDRLSSAEIDLLEQESALYAGFITEHITALLILEDVRVGDIIEIGFVEDVKTPLWSDHFFQSINTTWPAPIGKFDFRLLWPADENLFVRTTGDAPSPDVRTEDEWREYVVTISDPEPMRFERYVPSEYRQTSSIAFSTMSDWSDVSSWASDIFGTYDTLPDDFSRRVDRIAADWESAEDRAIEALRLVQNEVRYLSLLGGLGSHKPRDPLQTIESGYGDCKDKSLLLTLALRQMGIQAHPALVNTFNGAVLPQTLPSVLAFNHAIVRAEINGQDVWLDPTLSHQGGQLSNLSVPDYRYALTAKEDETDLITIEKPAPQHATRIVEETFTFPVVGDDGLLIHVSNTYRGGRADNMRRTLADGGSDGRERSYLNFYTRQYNGIRVTESVGIEDDIITNTLKTTISFALSRELFEENGYDKKFQTYAHGNSSALPRELGADRTAPLSLPYPAWTTHKITLRAPGRMFVPLEDEEFEAPGVSYSRTWSRDEDVLSTLYELRVTERSVSLEQAATVVDLANEISNKSRLNYNVADAAPTYELRLGLNKPLEKDLANRLDRVLLHIAREKPIDALEILNELEDQYRDPNALRGFIQHLRGLETFKLGRREAATSMLREAFALHSPVNAQSYFSYLEILRQDGELEETGRIVIQMMKAVPEMAQRVNLNSIREMANRLKDEGYDFLSADVFITTATALNSLSESEGELSTDGQTTDLIFSSAVDALVERNQAEKARAFIPHLQDPRYVTSTIMSLEAQAIWPDIEEIMGPDLQKGMDRFVDITRRASDDDPDNFRKQTRHMKALRWAGRFEEAIEFGGPRIGNWSKVEAVGADAYWLVNEYAQVLAEANRAEEADQILRQLLTIGLKDNGTLINMAINRAIILMEAGEFDGALQAVHEIEEAEEQSRTAANPYGRMIMYWVKACALNELGNRALAMSIKEHDMKNIFTRNWEAYTATLLCLGNNEEAQDYLIYRLQDPIDRATAIESFVRSSPKTTRPEFGGKITARAEQIRTAERVMEVFRQYARPLTVAAESSAWNGY